MIHVYTIFIKNPNKIVPKQNKGITYLIVRILLRIYKPPLKLSTAIYIYSFKKNPTLYIILTADGMVANVSFRPVSS